jgi:hypothetical protein
MSRQLLPAAALALALAINGAACTNRYDTPQDAEPAAPDSLYVAAYNENFYDARVHAVFGSGQRRSLGTIAGNGGQSRTAIPWEPRPLIFEIVFIIDGSAYVSQPVDVGRNETIELRLPPNMSQSGYFRRVSRE